MKNRISEISEIFLSRAWALLEDMVQPISQLLSCGEEGLSKAASLLEAAGRGRPDQASAGYRIQGDRGIIPIHGVITKRGSQFGVSTIDIADQFNAALADPAVKEIVLDIDSPGGSVAGVPELADMISRARGKKKITAYASGLIASAAYWIGSAADKIYATKATEVGSIGVYMVAFDATVLAHNFGIKAEVIKAGRNKATGHPLKHMTNEDKQTMQDQVDAYFRLFKDAVQANRGMDAETIDRVALGRTWLAAEAQALGLIDGVSEFVPESKTETGTKASDKAGVPFVTATTEETTMDLSKLTLEALVSGRPDLVAALKAQHAAEFKADPKKAEQADLDAASANGAQFERLRIAQIVSKGNLPEYQGCGAIVQDAVVNGLSVKEAEDRMKDHRLKNLQNAGAPAVGAAGAEVVADLSRLSVEERCKVLWEKDPAVRADFDNVEQFILYEKKYASRHKAGSAK